MTATIKKIGNKQGALDYYSQANRSHEGYDLILSAPRDVSIRYAMASANGDLETVKAIEEAILEANRAVIQRINAHATARAGL